MTPVPTIATFLISSIFFTIILLVVGTSLRGQQELALRFLDRLPSPQRALVKSESTPPLRFVRSSRNEHGPKRSRRLGQVDLLVEPLIGAERSLCGEHIRGDIGAFFRGAGRRLGKSFIEEAERQLPEHSASERDNNLVASSLHGAPAQGCENAHSAEPAHNVVADGLNRRLLRTSKRPFGSKDTRHRCTSLIKARPVRPRPCFSVKN